MERGQRIKMLIINLDDKTICGTAKVADIKQLGLVEASRREHETED
jgi:hypothetical protein